jgi:uncharacterized protein YkwD
VRGILAGAVLTLAVTAAACGPAEAPPPPGCPGGPPDALTSSLLNFTNASRGASGKPALGWNARLACLATEWSNVMAGGRGLAHRDLSTIAAGLRVIEPRREHLRRPEGSPRRVHTAW